MLGIPNAELLLILGATAALLGPKDLPIVARAAGRLVGSAIGYLAIVRQHVGNAMQQSQATKVHKDLQDLYQQVDAIRYELRGYSIMNPGPMTRKLMDTTDIASPSFVNKEKVDENHSSRDTISKNDSLEGKGVLEKFNDHAGLSTVPHLSTVSTGVLSSGRGSSNKEPVDEDHTSRDTICKDHSETTISSTSLHSQAVAYSRLAEAATLMKGSLQGKGNKEELNDHADTFTVLPVSAESVGLLPNRKDDASGSDIVLEAILEEHVAINFKQFLGSPK